jgi:hypothetical protein
MVHYTHVNKNQCSSRNTYEVDFMIMASRENILAFCVKSLDPNQFRILDRRGGKPTMLKMVSRCPSPANIATQGWVACSGIRLHNLIVVSSDAEAKTYGFIGETARSLTSLCRLVKNLICAWSNLILHHDLVESKILLE